MSPIRKLETVKHFLMISDTGMMTTCSKDAMGAIEITIVHQKNYVNQA